MFRRINYAIILTPRIKLEQNNMMLLFRNKIFSEEFSYMNKLSKEFIDSIQESFCMNEYKTHKRRLLVLSNPFEIKFHLLYHKFLYSISFTSCSNSIKTVFCMVASMKIAKYQKYFSNLSFYSLLAIFVLLV